MMANIYNPSIKERCEDHKIKAGSGNCLKNQKKKFKKERRKERKSMVCCSFSSKYVYNFFFSYQQCAGKHKLFIPEAVYHFWLLPFMVVVEIEGDSSLFPSGSGPITGYFIILTPSSRLLQWYRPLGPILPSLPDFTPSSQWYLSRRGLYHLDSYRLLLNLSRY